jgi:hypothetical protein
MRWAVGSRSMGRGWKLLENLANRWISLDRLGSKQWRSGEVEINLAIAEATFSNETASMGPPAHGKSIARWFIGELFAEHGVGRSLIVC